ncbi:glycoside hydrolase family 76 protein [Mucilaginibacter sp. dw_454]|uniref:glycoside hydrolase family 76 protein n=1 Tax=Mucilaginibacter sp. dw_454 TaxID=2720079 RepID=UPI001BD61DD0|nr:glycoside hydrolase family 76 protein [Mucilaginibacter sp. dw_454]
MNTQKRSLIFALLLTFVSGLVSSAQAQDGHYYKEMKSLQTAIETNFHDPKSGNYFVELDPAKREHKNGYIRDYTYLWSYCAMYQAANEIEKLEPKANLMEPMRKLMYEYYSPAPPAPGFTDYIMNLKPGERYYDDNEWIGIASLDAYDRTKKKVDFDLGKAMYDFIMTGHDQVLGGGIYWKEGDLSSKNTCSNGPGALVALQLYEATKNKAYLDTAIKIVNWTDAKLKSPENLYWDNIRTKDGSIGKGILSYNTGTPLEAYIYLYEITKEKKYLDEANTVADASLTFFYGNGKFRDDYWFNAVLLRAYQHLLKYNKDTKYIIGFKKALDYTLQNQKNDIGLFTGRDGVRNLVDHGGLLEILARYAWLEKRYDLKG